MLPIPFYPTIPMQHRQIFRCVELERISSTTGPVLVSIWTGIDAIRASTETLEKPFLLAAFPVTFRSWASALQRLLKRHRCVVHPHVACGAIRCVAENRLGAPRGEQYLDTDSTVQGLEGGLIRIRLERMVGQTCIDLRRIGSLTPSILLAIEPSFLDSITNLMRRKYGM